MADSIDTLKKLANLVRYASATGENTAERVGRLLVGILEVLVSGETFDKRYIRKDIPDFTDFLLKLLGGVEVGTFKEGVSGAKIDKDGNAELGSLLTRFRAILAELKVLGDSEFDGNLSSKDFVSGFTSGKGWAIMIKEVLNALGVKEHKSVMELDDLIVRGTLRVFEFIVSQMLGENDNRTFTAMMEVDHYDPETGRVWLKTQDGRLYNPFRIDDYILVQQYNGMPSEENNHYVTKHYELIITGAGMGEVAEGGKAEDRLDWVTFRNFTCDMEGGTVELITAGDTFVRVDNASDPDRKGIIQLMTVGNTTPYMDIIYGLKTDPDNSLKGRFGNLQGIYHHLFGWLKEFGAYLINLYAVGVFRLRNTGEDLETKFDILQNQFSTSYQKLKMEVTDEDNFLKNATFTENLDGWQSENDIKFLTDGEKPIYINRSLYTAKNKVAGVERYDGQNMLRLVNSYVKQANADIRKPGKHKEYKKNADGSLSEVYVEVPDTIYLNIKFVCRRTGVLTIGFQGAGTSVGALPYVTMPVEQSSEYNKLEWSGTWDGTGDFLLQFTGDMYVSLLAVTTNPLDDYRIELSTRFEQSAERIAMLGTRIDRVNDTVTDLGIELSAQEERIKLWADKTDNINVTVTQLGVELNAAKGELSLWATKTDTLNKTVTDIGVDLNSTKGRLDLYVNKTDNINGLVTQLGVDMDAAEKAISLNASAITDTRSDLAGLKVKTNEISGSVTHVTGLVGNAQSVADSAYTIATSARTLADKAMYTGSYGSEEYNQSSNPWSSWQGGTEYKHVGAIWYNPSTGGTQRYEGYDNSNTWVTVNSSAYASASYVLQNKDKWSMVVANFDGSGNPTAASGLVTTVNGSSLYATRSEYSSTSALVSKHEAFINVNSDNIQMAVRKDGIISSINQSAEKIRIKASQLELEGTVTANDNVMITLDGRIIGKGAQFENVIMQSKIVNVGGSVYTSVPAYPKVGDVYGVNVSSLKTKGDSTFANLPTINLSVGDCYRITGGFTLGFIDYPAYTYLVWTSLGWNVRYGVWTYQRDGWEILHGAVWRSDTGNQWTVHINPRYCTSYFATGGSTSYPVRIFPPAVSPSNYGTIIRIYCPSDVMTGDDWHSVDLCFADTTAKDERTIYLKEGGHGGYAELASTPKGWHVKGTHMGCNEQLCIRTLIVGNSYRYYESINDGVGGSSFINYNMTVERKEKGVANVKLTSYNAYFFKDAIFRVSGYGGVDDNFNAPIKATLFGVTQLTAYSVLVQVRLSDDSSVNDPYMDVTGFMLDVYLGNSLYL